MNRPSLSLDAFIEEAGTRLQREGLSEKVRVDLSAPRSGTVSLDYLEVIDPISRRQGLGTRALLLLLQISDESGIALIVIPRSLNGSMDDDALAAWYGHHGFKLAPTLETPRLMRRDPSL
jgi:hypothetical protein